MSRPVTFPAAAAAAAWAAAAVLAALQSRGLVVPSSFTLCPVRLLTGHLCPGCGMGRSVVSAMRGAWGASFAQHPLGLSFLLLWTAWLTWGAFNLSRGREFSEGFLPVVRRPAFAWTALAATIIAHVARVV
ncbi:MAG TPA: hypothetical protein DCZ01_09040 [Elusimicrobia bacterium]|nr:MAG: hypothetical protein A2X37_09150 [Elusimicrobia bacterium GWA2_66_18]OGR71578.1 MAG: hypothetical protein A2X40_05045 [Elusimicrobia bacterium GWC2_65_9]HAZ08646.1 hypothetical protein [Elusimicrobiota bacterium]